MNTLPPSTTDTSPDEWDNPTYIEQPPEELILVPRHTIEMASEDLELVARFLRDYANLSLREDLRTFALAQGWHPITGPSAFIDRIAFGADALNDLARRETDALKGAPPTA